MGDLIDTTEMYLKTIYEMNEDGVPPLRARIVERLGHSGPTVSQTIGRMERDGLVHVRDDRRLELTDEGLARATEVMHKHRLAELLLLNVIGLDWAHLHVEACRWEHVMSDQVEERLQELLADTSYDPYGNPLPGVTLPEGQEYVSLATLASGQVSGASEGFTPPSPLEGGAQPYVLCDVVRIGEPVQADQLLLEEIAAAGIRPGSRVRIKTHHHMISLTLVSDQPLVDNPEKTLAIPLDLAPHFFVAVVK